MVDQTAMLVKLCMNLYLSEIRRLMKPEKTAKKMHGRALARSKNRNEQPLRKPKNKLYKVGNKNDDQNNTRAQKWEK